MIGRRFKDFFSRDRKKLYMILSIVLVSVFSLTIVYAALSVTLNITGNAQVVASTWDIHLDNVKVTSGSVSGTDPSITSPTTATFSTTLNMPGDFYEFTIDVVNNGSIDATIDSVTKTPTLTEAQAKYLNYIVEYQNGELINTKQLVQANSFVRLKVRVEFRKDITASDLPTTSETLNLAFTVNYVQSDGSGSSVKGDGKILGIISGDLDTVGSEVCLGTECFYVIGNDGNVVKMLAKYNLHVGYECSGTANSTCVLYNNPSGVQDSSMTGLGKGTVNFSDSAYWSGKVDTFPYYVYSVESSISSYLENYMVYLSRFDKTISNIRLISYEELYSLGCDEVVEYNYLKCDLDREWIYSSNYWAGSIVKSNVIWNVLSGNRYGYFADYYLRAMAGVRPVIEISISEFE